DRGAVLDDERKCGEGVPAEDQMNMHRTMDSVLADYDDAPGRQTKNPLNRSLRAVGALSSLLLAAAFAVLVAFNIVFRWEVYFGAGIVSSLTTPLIMLFWSEEVAWTGEPFSVGSKLAAVSILTWVVEMILSVCIVVAVATIFE